jgi:SAM-dependent methyltransferase
MEKGVDSTHPDFWTSRYVAGKTPWDFGGLPAALKSFLTRSSAPGRVLIPGCGSAHEVQAFHEAGYDVTAIDFSPAAIDQAKRGLGVLAGRVIFGDFFTYNFEQGRFDLIYERTFLCSMPPSHWPDYANRMSDLLSSEGRLIGIFLYGQQPEPPPYALTDKQAEQLFQKRFRQVRSELVTDSLPLFRGLERWHEWLKIDQA